MKSTGIIFLENIIFSTLVSLNLNKQMEKELKGSLKQQDKFTFL